MFYKFLVVLGFINSLNFINSLKFCDFAFLNSLNSLNFKCLAFLNSLNSLKFGADWVGFGFGLWVRGENKGRGVWLLRGTNG